ncbi:MAG TPA: UvrD-helicase domain-containing protein, partial [Spongiibacteraceae bacterium]
MTISLPVDAAQRASALDPTQSFCVTAPAGSGKTELLSQRVLALLAQVQQPEEILAITFTRKAAAEMRERILQALRAAQNTEPSEPHKRHTWRLARAALSHAEKNGWNLLENPARLRVQTIDGLCGSLTAQMPVLSQFGGQPRVTERAQPLYREAIDALLQQLEQDDAVGECLGALLLHMDNRVERLHELLASLLACRDQWLPHIYIGIDRSTGINSDGSISSDAVRMHLENTLRQIRSDALAKLGDAIQIYGGELLALLDFAAARLSESQPKHPLCLFAGCIALPDFNADAVEHWQLLANWLLTDKGTFRKRVTVKEGFPPAEGMHKLLYKQRKEAMQALLETFATDEGLRELLDEVRYLPAANYPASQWQILVQLTRVLMQAVAQLRLVFQIRGEVDFTEISLSALQALGGALNPSDLMLRLDQRINHLLIDEFQDTSSTQFRLLQRLIEGWREHNESGAAPRTLFIVGDGMQSIYGFREAKVGLFLEAREQGINQVRLVDAPLSVNFRSTPTVVNWINRVFEQAFPALEHVARGAVPYENSTAFNDDAPFSEVAIYGVRNDPQRTAEAQRCVELVQQALQRDANGSVAILVRSRPHLYAIVPALQRAGILFRATDIDPLAQRAHVQDALILLKALLNPADRIAWLALLRAPLIGLDHRDLHLVAAGADGGGVRTAVLTRLRDHAVRAQLSAVAARRIDYASSVIEQALRQRARKPLRSWLEGIWIALGGELLTRTNNAAEDMQALFDLLEQCGEEFAMYELEQRLQNLYARADNDSDARVVLMTIHKSKGLEFDTVIVPALDAGARSDDKPLLRWSEYLAADGALGIALAAKSAMGGADDTIYRWLEFEHKQQKRLEDTRLLYVAATRAIKRLYLLFRTNDAQEFKTPSSHSLLNRIWDAVQAEVIWSDALAPALVYEEIDDAAILLRIPAHWRLPEAEEIVVSNTDNTPQLL